jgi:hypothetical protein
MGAHSGSDLRDGNKITAPEDYLSARAKANRVSGPAPLGLNRTTPRSAPTNGRNGLWLSHW